MSRAGFQPRREPKTSDLLIRQKVEAMIEYGHCALRQFPKSERHVLSAEIRGSMWALLRLVLPVRRPGPWVCGHRPQLRLCAALRRPGLYWPATR